MDVELSGPLDNFGGREEALGFLGLSAGYDVAASCGCSISGGRTVVSSGYILASGVLLGGRADVAVDLEGGWLQVVSVA